MSQLHGKQLRNLSTSLDKLSGTGLVSFTASAVMNFTQNAKLTTADINIVDGIDVVNKNYVDSVASGLEVKESARVIAVGPITLSGTQTIDGVSVVAGDRVLVNGQTDKKTNGIYVAATASWSRAEDMDEPNEINGGEFVFIRQGNVYADTGWVATLPDSQMTTIGDADIQFTQFSSAGVIGAGDGLEKIGNTISIKDTLAGSGLTYSNATGIMDVNVNSAALEINGSDEVALKSTITGARTFSDYLTANGGLDVNGGATVSGDTLLENKLTVTGQVDANGGLDVAGGATVSAGGLNVTGGSTTDTLTVTGTSSFTGLVTATGGVTASTGFFTTSLQTPNAPQNGNDVINLTYFGASYSQLQNQIDNIDADFITAIEVGAGLTVSSATAGTASISILDTTAGAGLTFAAGVYNVNLGVNSGLTFSGDNIIINTTIAGNGLDFSNGVLTVNTSEVTTALAGNGLTANGAALDVNVDAAALEVTNDVVTLKSTITGQRTFSNGIVVSEGATVSGQLVANNGVSVTSGGLTVSNNTQIGGDLNVLGNFTVAGTFSYINTTELLVEDNYITLNSGLTSGTGINGGIELLRGSDTAASILWNEALDLWQVGLSGSESSIITEAGTGLTKSGNTLSINTSGFATTLAGNGLTANGGALDVNVDISGLTISNDVVALQSTITGARTFSDYLTANGGLDVNAGLTVSGNTLLENTLTVSGLVDANAGLDVAGGVIATGGATVSGFVNLQNNLSVTGTSSFTGLVTANGLTANNAYFSGTLQSADSTPTDNFDVINLQYFGGSYSQLQNQITNISNDVITEVIAGNGLVGGGTTGSVTLDVNTGLGLTLSNDAVQMVWGGTSSGLTFSSNGVKANVDGTTIIINGSGQLQVVAGSAQPVYQVSTGAVLTSGLTLTSTPNTYSRLQVFINGLEESVQFTGVTNPAVNVSGTTLTWNASNAGYSIDAQDEVRVIYEA